MTTDADRTAAEKPTAATTWDAKLYDDKHAFVWKHGASLVALLEPKPGERILDLGCGTGHLTAEIAKSGAEVVGIDQDGTMIDEARRLYPQLRFQQADAREFTLAQLSSNSQVGDSQAQPFDAVFSNAVLHWVRPPEAAARRIAAVLRPGGRFIAEFGGHGNVQLIVAALRKALERFAGGESLRFVPDWYYPSIAEHTAVLESVGLETTSAMLFPRRTLLKSAEGVRHWVRMFVAQAVEAMPEERREEFFATIEDDLRAELFSDGQWYADYRRLRLVAQKIA